jgi:hypothetical protein
LPGALTPSLQEDLVRLGTWMPFERAAGELGHFRRTAVSRATAERLTEAAGAAYVAWQTAEVVRIEREVPEAPGVAAKQFLSVDGATVPLVGGEWAEVKTLVIGEVESPVMERGERVIHTSHHSYFSRLIEAETFQRLALVETQRRGVENAPAVAAVTDGADWIQKFIDHHRDDAVRILDFPHAAEYVNAVGQAHWGEDSSQGREWVEEQLHQLKHAGPTAVLSEVRRVWAVHPDHSEMATQVAYLEKRAAHMQYPMFQAAGWPIGDGAVESANKLVVEARLKGSGMHWARTHVDPMLALRNIVCSDRWEEAWPQIVLQFRQQAQQQRRVRRQQRHAATLTQPIAVPTSTPATPEAQTHPPHPEPHESPRQPWRPPPNHPWRHMPVGRARFKPSPKPSDAKT